MSRKGKTPRDAASYRGARRNAARLEANLKGLHLASVWRSPAEPAAPASTRKVNPSTQYGANPLHDPAGRKRWIGKALDPVTKQMVDVKMRGPRNPSRWLPHQSVREMARRQVRRILLEGRADG